MSRIDHDAVTNSATNSTPDTGPASHTPARTRLRARPAPTRTTWQLEQGGLHPLLARLYAGRGVTAASDVDHGLASLLPPTLLRGASEAAVLLADAIEAEASLLIVADYDCDGATACAVGLRALRLFGARVSYLVPDRLVHGYGLSPAIVDLAAQHPGGPPDLLVTVDNGIASVDGVEHALSLGIATLITDHHLPGDTLPPAECIVNPNQPGCDFPSKNLAGVGVMFYVMLALRAELRARGAFAERPEPNLAKLLDLVALGTVADVVSLDHNNRTLVSQGLQRIRAGQMAPGIAALFRLAGRDASRAQAQDLGFAIGPRLNAAGRLADMALGIEALITDDPARAANIAQQLDQLNRERRSIEAEMQQGALALLEPLLADPAFLAAGNTGQAGICLFDPDWHPGVVGIIASRLKDKLHRPVFAFARGENGELKGSGRSIPGLHLRDVLDLVAKREPGLLPRFGGHAAAAGATLQEADFPRFVACFAAVVAERIDPDTLTRTLHTDGPLETAYCSLDIADLLERQIWGQGFPPPLFEGEFTVERQRLIKDRHLKLQLRQGAQVFEAIHFNCTESPPERIRAAFQLDINEYQGRRSIQFKLEHFEALA